MPLQAADYWRIRRHRQRGDVPSHGYFRGIKLQNAPPLVYLVAPSLRPDPTTKVLLRYISPEIEYVQLGLVESWRRGFRAVMRRGSKRGTGRPRI